MRLGKNPKKRRSKTKSNPLPDPQPNLVVGQISSNLIDSLYGPILMKMAEQSVENYADEALQWSDAQSVDVTLGEDAEAEVQVELDGTIQEQGNTFQSNINTPKPKPPLFSSSTDLESLTSLLTDVSTHFTSTYKAHANLAKLERLLDEKYGRLRPFIESHPQVEWAFKKIQRKYVRGEFSPIGKRPMGLSSAVILLFMMRQRVETSVLILVGLFTIVGLQPWALVLLISVGKFGVDKRRKKRMSGMSRRLKVVESYYAYDGEESEDEEKKRKFDLLKAGVGTNFNPADLTLRDETFDVICLGSGVEVLYAAALLS